ncbi:hypothetical protein [Halovenus salina]|uniref:TRASH domain-containing protein n=1 Tax=Halovenus salina TaxID=1510225 RepID=A0ABD5W394_9EURY
MKVHHARAHNESIAGEEVGCSRCGTTITRTPYQLKEYEHQFCSEECEKAWRQDFYAGENNPNAGAWVTEKCEWCGETEDIPEWRQDSFRFCSPECRHRFLSEERSGEASWAWGGGKTTIVCGWCGDDAEVTPAVADKRRFCSPECADQWKTEAYTGEGNPSWDGGPETVSCEYCGGDYEIEAAASTTPGSVVQLP